MLKHTSLTVHPDCTSMETVGLTALAQRAVPMLRPRITVMLFSELGRALC